MCRVGARRKSIRWWHCVTSNRGGTRMQTLWHDLRYGARMLRKNPGVTAVAVVTLALGIGANTAIFSVVNAVMLRPLPYRNPDRLVSLWANVPEHGRWRTAPANFFDWKKQNKLFEDMAAYGAWTMTLTGDGEPEQMLGTLAGAGYFSVVGVEPMLGRLKTGITVEQAQAEMNTIGARLAQEYPVNKGEGIIVNPFMN